MDKRRQDRRKGPKGLEKKPLAKYNHRPFSWLILGLVAMAFLLTMYSTPRKEEISYAPDFVNYIDAGHIESVYIHKEKIVGKFNEAGMAAREAED
jgi:hypothetical protein